MTLTLKLPPDLERRLREEAERRGMEPDQYALDALERSVQKERNAAAIDALRAFREGDAEEQRETGEYLMRSLDEDRLSDRKFFP